MANTPYDPMNPNPQTSPTAGYNNPWFDQQGNSQQGGSGSFQPMPNLPGGGSGSGNGGGMDYTNPPYNPDYYNWYSGSNSGNFNSFNPQGSGGATTMPVQNPDIFGGGGGSGGLNRNFNNFNFNTPTGGTYTDEFGNQQPITPISFGPKNGGGGNGYGGTMFNGQQVDLYPPDGSGGGLNRGAMGPNGGSVNVAGQQVGLYPQGAGVGGNAGAGAGAAAAPSAPAFDQSQMFKNLFGQGQGYQQGFGELYGKQFVSGSPEFNRVFGSTQGQGYGNNFNWNIQPGLVGATLDDPNFRAQAAAIARANPTLDFEPALVDGKYVLASRAQDPNAQKSLLAPVLPPAPVSGGGYGGGSSGGGGARTSAYGSSGGGYSNGYGGTGNGGTQGKTYPPYNPAISLAANLGVGTKGNVVQSPAQQGTATPAKEGDTYDHGKYVYHNGGWVPTSGPINAPYLPVSGTGAGYYPTPTNLPPSVNTAFPWASPGNGSGGSYTSPITSSYSGGGGTNTVTSPGYIPTVSDSTPPSYAQPTPTNTTSASEPANGAISQDGTMIYSGILHQWLPRNSGNGGGGNSAY